MNLKNKKVLITGATGGIGNCIVEKFHNLGASIVASGTNEEKLNNLKKKFSNIITEKFKLDEHDKITDFIDDIDKKLDGLDILVNNAGITLDNLSIRLTEENWKKVIDINLTSSFLMCKFAIKKMLKRKYGKIINITSIVGHTGNLGQANYAASKAGIVAFSKSLAIEYATKNININCVSPGFIKTEMTEKISEEFKKNLMSDEVKNKIKKIVADHLGIEEEKVTEEASFIDDLGADSLDTVELVMAFEEEFGSEISDSEAEKILTVGDAIKFIESKAS